MSVHPQRQERSEAETARLHERLAALELPDPTELPAGPDSVKIEAFHLSITQEWKSSSHNIHLLENSDLGVILKRGQKKRLQIPYDAENGTLVIALNVDEDHDEVHYSGRAGLDSEEVLGQALEALVACRSALMRVRKS